MKCNPDTPYLVQTRSRYIKGNWLSAFSCRKGNEDIMVTAVYQWPTKYPFAVTHSIHIRSKQGHISLYLYVPFTSHHFTPTAPSCATLTHMFGFFNPSPVLSCDPGSWCSRDYKFNHAPSLGPALCTFSPLILSLNWSISSIKLSLFHTASALGLLPSTLILHTLLTLSFLACQHQYFPCYM